MIHICPICGKQVNPNKESFVYISITGKICHLDCHYKTKKDIKSKKSKKQ